MKLEIWNMNIKRIVFSILSSVTNQREVHTVKQKTRKHWLSANSINQYSRLIFIPQRVQRRTSFSHRFSLGFQPSNAVAQPTSYYLSIHGLFWQDTHDLHDSFYHLTANGRLLNFMGTFCHFLPTLLFHGYVLRFFTHVIDKTNMIFIIRFTKEVCSGTNFVDWHKLLKKQQVTDRAVQC